MNNEFLFEAIHDVVHEFGQGCNQAGCIPPQGGSYPNGANARAFGKHKPGSKGVARTHRNDQKNGVRSPAVQAAVDKSRREAAGAATNRRAKGTNADGATTDWQKVGAATNRFTKR